MKKYVDIDDIYPIGSIYFSVNDVDPSTLFGGSWEQIKDKFLLTSGTKSLGSTGGTESHAHNYGIKYGGYYKDTIIEKNTNAGLLNYNEDNTYTLSTEKNLGNISEVQVNASSQNGYSSVSVAHYEHIAQTSTTSNMPPYLVINAWKRIG